jgi:hypothetical protein
LLLLLLLLQNYKIITPIDYFAYAGNYVYEHEKYETKLQRSANGIFKNAAVACDSVGGSAVGK